VIVQVVQLGLLPASLIARTLESLPAVFQRWELVSHSVDMVSCYDRQRAQHNAYELLLRLRERFVLIDGPGCFRHLPTFGAAEVSGRRAIASCARLRTAGEAEHDESVLERRLLVEIVHELGHAAGLIHCPVSSCAMHRSLWVESIDLKEADYCPSCYSSCSTAEEGRFVLTRGSCATG
jgi:archaemetzincin